MKLEGVAPAWTAAIRDRLGVHGGRDLPGDPMLAWQWRQLRDELERRASTSLEDLQEQIARLSTQLQQVTAELVEKRAWAAQTRAHNARTTAGTARVESIDEKGRQGYGETSAKALSCGATADACMSNRCSRLDHASQ